MTQTEPLRVVPVAQQDEAAALELLWPEVDAAERWRRRELLRAPHAPLAPFWGGYRGERLVGVMRVGVQPGRTATISPPRTIAAEFPSTSQELLSAVLSNLAHEDVRLVQALLATDAADDAAVLTQAGLAHWADLNYLVSLKPALAEGVEAVGLELTPYRPADRADWQRLIARTYIGSLDCPGIEGLRTMDDVLDGYQATGVFDPRRWLWARQAGDDVGCLLLADDPAQSQWEVTYLGVVPEARGRGFGLSLIRHAQWMTHHAGRQRLVLAVDAANHPALAIYERAGFLHWDRRLIYLRAL
jgi:mycothiol synthase